MIKVIDKSGLAGSPRHVVNQHYESFRFLMREDGSDVTVTDIVLKTGVSADYGYDAHSEVAYCISGEAMLTDLSTGKTHRITAGTLWTSAKGDRFRFMPLSDTRLICVFSPPFAGGETGFAGDQ